MGPTISALVHLFKADQRLRDAQARLDAAARNVRIQERRVHDLSEKMRLAHTSLREQRARGGQLELELAARDAHIEKLRVQQQTAKNNKEYQAFLIEINTGKVDRSKLEDEAMKVMEAVEKSTAEGKALEAHLEAEKAKLEALKTQIGDELARLQAEVDERKPEREAEAAKVPAQARAAFERLAERFEGEALSRIDKPDRRREEYLCTACNMELVQDVYNKLRTRDEIVYCPSCRRILYIPEDLTPEHALGTGKGAAPKRTRAVTTRPRASKADAAGAAEASDDVNGSRAPVTIEKRAKGKLGDVLRQAQGETVLSANKADQKPVECEVFIDGELAGIYKGQTPEALERAIRYYMDQAKMTGAVRVAMVSPAPPAEPVPQASLAPSTPSTPAGELPGESPAAPLPTPTVEASAPELPSESPQGDVQGEESQADRLPAEAPAGPNS